MLAGCLYSDVTDRVAAERALVESEQHRRRTASLVAMDRIALAASRHDDRRVERAVTRARATLEEATERTAG